MLVERVPPVRIQVRNDLPARSDGQYVLYWMTGARRPRYNFALDRALEWSRSLGKPLLVFEPLRAGYEHASDRFHSFVIDGMRAHVAHFGAANVRYVPYVEPSPGEGRDLLSGLARDAAVVIGDESVTFFLGRMIEAAARKISVRYETVDSNGLLPLAAIPAPFARAYDFRRFLQKNLAPHLRTLPLSDPLSARATELAAVPADVAARYGLAAQLAALEEPAALLSRLPIDHRVGVVADRGGFVAGGEVLKRFVEKRLSRYPDRSHPDDDAASGLSFWLHFGQVSAHQVLAAVADATEWTPDKIGKKASGQKDGWWNASEAADAFLDELVTWRELGQARCRTTTDYKAYAGVPVWARNSLEKHASDPREHLYDEAQLEAGETDDLVWNAAMHQLREEGRIQNYLRMLWGKRVLTWTKHPEEAFDLLVRLNDRWSVDGRDPASYSNIGWVFGSYDRPWAPERPIFGVIRVMTSGSAVRKLRMREYLARWGTGVGTIPGPMKSPVKDGLQGSLDLE